MSKRKYPCPLADDGYCEHGGNKVFNWGFAQGTESFCRLPKINTYTYNLETCPKDRDWKAWVKKQNESEINMNEEILEITLDYLRDLADEWEWKRNSTDKNNREMYELDENINKLKNMLEAERG